MGSSKEIKHRLHKLETHLVNESPLLVDAVKGFRELDRIGYRLGLLGRDQSYATQIPWWPLISVLGTYSAGKSTFINSYINYPLQETGNQAVDDKFTVICYASGQESRSLPGVALDADPRFPFYQIADELEHVEPGDGARVNAYLQLKTCPSEKLRGYIFIDSPGFDADAQRTATLRITDYIIDLSDLVLVFFDARHPEAGTMRDTLEHLVASTIQRKDANKFIFVLNQIDTTAREDNPEEVVSSWHKALSQNGLTAGRFYTIYNAEAAVPIENASVRERFAAKCREDMQAIGDRITEVHVERVYRILGNLEKKVREIEQRTVPELQQRVRAWGRGVVWRDAFAFIVLLAIFAGTAVATGNSVNTLQPEGWVQTLWNFVNHGIWHQIGAVAIIFLILFVVHHWMRRLSLRAALRRLAEDDESVDREGIRRALIKNTRFIHSIFRPEVVGWRRSSRNRLRQILEEADEAMQRLNDKYTRPSGDATTS
ncbi:MAG: dynamin family protein [Gammaproteobacteria bacterium]|nr:dynamin family protein [Gammaproteobacteria bacterium]